MGLFSTNSSLASIVQDLIGLINMLVGVLAALAVVIFFFGLVRFISKSDDAGSLKEGRTSIMWSLIALFVLFSIWGILQILSITFFGGTIYNGNANPAVDSSFQGVGGSPY